jgi:hypothetical protein
LDAQLHDIEPFERVVAAFFEEYMNSEAPAVPSTDRLGPGQGPDGAKPEAAELDQSFR